MSAYYNENDPQLAEWLRVLISMGEIASGIVDERSITDVEPADLRGYTQCHFFAGVGAWSLALRAAGWSDLRPVWTGSCPCQPFSVIGERGRLDDERHLWPAFARLIRAERPCIVMGEQVASADVIGKTRGTYAGEDSTDWIDLVHADLENAHYQFGALVTAAAGVGAPCIRQRTYWVGSTGESGLEGHPGGEDAREEPGRLAASAHGSAAPAGLSGGPGSTEFWDRCDWLPCFDQRYRPVQPGTRPLVDGPARELVQGSDLGNEITPNSTQEARKLRLHGYGNAVNVANARLFAECVMEEFS